MTNQWFWTIWTFGVVFVLVMRIGTEWIYKADQ